MNDSRVTTLAALEERIASATRALLERQKPDGHWVFELEADATIPAEYVLMRHFLAEPVDAEIERKIAVYLRRIQGQHGGWPLFHEGAFDMSASVKAYFALKMIGDPIDAPHMRRAREAILERGGAARANVFTRTLLALYRCISWRAVPMMPVEVMLLPKWFPFHLTKVSYWSRTVIVPLLVLLSLKPKARNPKGVRIDELFIGSPDDARLTPRAPQQNRWWFAFFRGVDHMLRAFDPWMPRRIRQRAVDRAVAFAVEHLNGEDGIGAIFPAMVNNVVMFDTLGYPEDHPHRAIARLAVEKLLTVNDEEAYCQPCFSPVWDTGLVCHALLEAGGERVTAPVNKGLDWLKDKQILDVKGDWADARPDVRPGGWAFQYNNPHYPDVDDTAVVALAMDRVQNQQGRADFREPIARAREWIVGMQSKNGGWGAFDADNTSRLVAKLPFCDFGAVTDPPSADVTAHVVEALAAAGLGGTRAARRGVTWLLRAQENDGSWFGRWGANYVYGTGAVVPALIAAGVRPGKPQIRRALEWLVAHQNPDGGWGEDLRSYDDPAGWAGRGESTASQTAWALLALIAAGGPGEQPSLEGGVRWLAASQRPDGTWDEPQFTGTGFPGDFYINYHLYRLVFPVSALGRYLSAGGAS
jgi:squalene-hopene/tetraprenyl-beta-curcumene cyclase